ncbi:MAG: glycerate kinase [Candidatus Bathyarchaeota archaeon]|nr:MAG: glycerate kinase [Candidatus Bathyarchaeota archaeon]
MVKEKVRLTDHELSVRDLRLSLKKYKRILVIGGGKASGKMAEAIEEILNNRIEAGIINVPHGTAKNFDTCIIQINEAAHPIPDQRGLSGVEKMRELLKRLDEKTLVILLLSGGGSALLPYPQEGITLEEQQKVTSLLLRCGARINEINTVRKHISQTKGGRLAALAYPATILCLIISDVVGDQVSSIASGPTAPNHSTFLDAVKILKYYDVWKKAPASVVRYLNNGVAGKNPECPKPGDVCFSKTHNIVLGSNRIALESAEQMAKKLGYNTLILSSYIEGEARHVGTVFSALARELIAANQPVIKPGVLLAGGETTVNVTGSGKGGRNQEMVLSAVTRLSGLKEVVFAAIDTDGVDGSTDAAGAVVDGFTYKRALPHGMDPITYLKNNNSHPFFKEINDLIYTGPTDTNVNDVIILVTLDER